MSIGVYSLDVIEGYLEYYAYMMLKEKLKVQDIYFCEKYIDNK